VAQGQGFGGFFEQLVPAQFKALVEAEFRYQVVVVGIEPLGQLLGVLAFAVLTTAAMAGTAGHAEQGVQGRAALLVEGGDETRRDHAEGQRVGQHLVVPGEVPHRQQVDTGVFLQLPVCGTQLAANVFQRGLVDIAFPVGFEGFFQLAVCADTGETKIVCQGHNDIPSCK